MNRSATQALKSFAMKRLLTAALLTTLSACGAEEVHDADMGSRAALSTTAAALRPADAELPEANGPCPDFSDDTLTFHPKGIPARRVRVFMSPAAKSKNGPLIFYWHGTGGNPGEASWGLGDAQINAIKDQGGLVAAPEHDPASGTWPWFLTDGDDRDDDLRVADEVVACAIKKVGINTGRIHSVGFSAGALHTTQMSYRRSNYIASVVTYSGGKFTSIPNKDPSNKFAAMIFFGGPNDAAGSLNFQQTSNTYHDDLDSKDHLAVICNHGNGHTVPQNTQAAVWRFLQDNTYGVEHPYHDGLPSIFPDFCHR